MLPEFSLRASFVNLFWDRYEEEVYVQFSIGQSVVHPAHGAGEIVDIEEMELVSGFKKYYVIEFIGKRLTMRVPVKRVEDLGMRKVMSYKRYQKVIKTLRSLPGQLPKNFKERRHKVAEMINSGLPVKIAEAIRELTWRRRESHLTKSDTELLLEGRERLIAEMALAADVELIKASHEVDEALSESVEAKESTIQAAA
jgi:CarD family transcriptional regulator